MAKAADSTFSTKLWQPGTAESPTLFEQYQILGIIGQGGMGTVYKGYHISLKRFVAIKTLRVDQAPNSDLVSRFQREVALVGQMDHPHVVRATDAGKKNGIFYLVMEYLAGRDLSQLVAQKGRLSIADACELIRQAALGLDYIHKTLIHRDIKPSNVLLTTAGQIKILDLGLARRGFADAGDSERTPEGCAVGTFSYIAPEQAMGDAQLDGRADIYSLGCTLFKLLTGHAPFRGPAYDSAAKLIHAHCTLPLTSATDFALIPEAVRPVLLRMTAKNPQDRPCSGAEVAETLASFAVGSQLGQLLPTAPDAVETPLRPLPSPLPTELSRLTQVAAETLLTLPSLPASPRNENRS